MSYYPLYLDLQDKTVLVVGGGAVACRKVQTLLEYGAIVKIVSPRLVDELQALVDEKQCFWIAATYSSEDIRGSALVFSCTEKEEVNARVAGDAQAQNIPVNVVDDPDKCSFLVPSILKRGDLSIAVSTAGSSPKVAALIRRQLEEIYGNEMAVYLALLRTWRQEIKNSLPSEKRPLFWEKVTDGRVLEHIRNGQLDQAKEVIENCFRSLLA